MPTYSKQATRILDTALHLAEAQSWQQLRLHQVATELNITLEDIHRHFQQKDDLVEAWFDRADRAMLQSVETPGFLELDTHKRLHHIIMSWFDTLAPHHQLTAGMLLYKMEPAHIHLQIQGILRISRTVQWFGEAAQSLTTTTTTTTDLIRILEEIALTSIYLATLVHWINDSSAHQQRTREFLAKRLHRATRGAQIVQGIPCFHPSVH